MTRRYAQLSLTTLALLTLQALVAAADWPQWGGSNGRNHVSTEKGLPESFQPGRKTGSTVDPATTRNVKWATKLGRYAYGNPTIAGGKVFVGTDDDTLRGDPRLKPTKAGLIQCFQEATGKLLWRLPTPKRTKLPKGAHYGHQHLGTCSSPAVEGDRVYFMTSAAEILCLDVDGQADGNDGPFTTEGQYMVGPGKKPIGLEPTDGDIIWRFDLMDELGVVPHDVPSCSPLILGDFLYTSTSNGVDGPHRKLVNPDAPSFIALDKKTGKLVAIDDGRIAKGMYHCEWSPPSCGTLPDGRTLIFHGGGDGICYAFQAIEKAQDKPFTLKTVWSYDCNPPHFRLRDGKPIPYYDGDKRKKRGNKSDGTYVGPSQIIATPVFHNARIYVAIGQDPLHGRGKGMLHCIDASKTGDITQTGKVWSYDAIDRSVSTVTIANGRVYAPDVAGRLHCLDADTGKPHWVYETKAEIWGSPLVADGRLYLGTKRQFYILADAGAQPRLLSKTSLGAPVYSSPVAANGTLYVASERFLWAVAKTAKP